MTNLSAHDVFWLARYAHNKLAPLIKAAQQYEPSIVMNIDMKFDTPAAHVLKNSIFVYVHWERPGLFIMSTTIRDKAGLDHWAKFIEAFIDTEQAALEAATDALAEEQAQADALADIGWAGQQERSYERADIERDEHDHDIDLHNEMAGN